MKKAPQRLQKLLAQAGVTSRRGAEELIRAGRVRLNGRIVRELGTKAHPFKDKVELDGRRIVLDAPEYYVLHKPRAVVSTLSDPEGRRSIADLIRRIPTRVYPIGRLDYHTSGVLLLTNDGDLAEALMHPRKNVPKIYVAKISGHVDEKALALLRNGMRIGRGQKTAPADVVVLREEPRSSWLQLTLHEGKNRQVHRMLEHVGRRVTRLARTSYAGITAEDLRPGAFRPLKSKELERLKRRYLAH